MAHSLLQLTWDDQKAMVGVSDQFSPFIARLLRSYFRSLGVKDAEMRLESPRSTADGNVDGQISSQEYTDPKGFFEGRTVFQFKASDWEPNRIRSDFQPPKPRKGTPVEDSLLVKLIRDENHNVAYILNAELSVQQVQARQQALAFEASKLRAGAVAFVLTAEHIRVIAETMPALVLDVKGSAPGFLPIPQALASKSGEFTEFTRTQQYEAVVSDLETKAQENRLLFLGRPGVGKSRTVLEAVASIPALRDVALYTEGPEQATALLRELGEEIHAVILVDEYVPYRSAQLDSAINEAPPGVCVIKIASGSSEKASGGRELAVPTKPEFEAIMTSRFSTLTRDQVSALSTRTGRFLRWAAYLAGDFLKAGDATPETLAQIELKALNGIEDADSVLALSLISRLDLGRLDTFCQIFQLDPRQCMRGWKSVHRSSQFVTLTPDIVYLTPDVFAEAACTRWVNGPRWDERIVQRIASEFPGEFRQRVEGLSGGEARTKLSGFFLPP